MAHPYREEGVRPAPGDPPTPKADLAPEDEPSVGMAYEESPDDDLHDELPVGRRWLVAGVFALTGLFFGVVFSIGGRDHTSPSVAPRSEVVRHLRGVVTSRGGNVDAHVGAWCTVDIADVQREGRACSLHIMCDGREQGFVAARCPLDPDVSPEARRELVYEAFDSNGRSYGRVTLALDPH
jgi:hypothetical protein